MNVERAREHAKARFRDRLVNGEQVGGCSCGDDAAPDGDGESVHVVGVRFRDSARMYFFTAPTEAIVIGNWVVVGTSRGEEAARVVIASHQMALSQLEGEPAPITRVLGEDDVQRMERFREQSSKVVRRGGEISRAGNLGIKVIAAEFAIDGTRIHVAYSAPDERYARRVGDELAREFGVPVDMVRVGPRDEARLIGGLGKCGRTLCCASWLPVYPDITMGMAKNQDLALNPSKVTGLCGRLLCCLSYENEQYRQTRQLLPRLGQRIATGNGPATVVSLQILKELVTIRYDESGRQETLPAAEVLGTRPAPIEAAGDRRAADETNQEDRPRRRRRRRRPRPDNGISGDN